MKVLEGSVCSIGMLGLDPDSAFLLFPGCLRIMTHGRESEPETEWAVVGWG
jgi:hypothetical protein